MCLFKRKNIISVEIIGRYEGISEKDALMNYAAGHMMGGFDGIVQADILNDSEGPTTTFLVKYDNGTQKIITAYDGSYEHYKYIHLAK